MTEPTRLHDLLADRALQGLDPDEGRELDRLLSTMHDATVADEFEQTTALLALARLDLEPMPPRLRARVEDDAIAWLANRRGLTLPAASAPAAPAPAPIEAVVAPTRRPMRVLPWLAAAAAVVLAVVSWWPSSGATAPTTSENRAAMLDRPGTIVVPWADNDLGVQGDIVWNEHEHAGVMRFVGLPRNDPSRAQYQLWVFDAERKAYTEFCAVDGGVFDATTDGEVLVPIDLKLDVAAPYLFAVTTEPPGGVVKHDPDLDPDRYRIVLTAPLSS